ncbi:MAG: hypothetical protein RMY31_011080 [Dendronalium sp. ChiSLP03b]
MQELGVETRSIASVQELGVISYLLLTPEFIPHFSLLTFVHLYIALEFIPHSSFFYHAPDS